MPFAAANTLAMLCVLATYVAFFLTLVFLRKPAEREVAAPRARDPISFLGIFVQGIAFAIVFFGPVSVRPLSFDTASVAEAAVPALLALGSLALFARAFSALGANWSFVARVREDHGLITSGPFGLVRNPIYLAMLMMLVAADLALGRVERLIVAIPIFYIGTVIRVLREERLLRAQFTGTYEEYAQRVRFRLIPGIW